MIIYKHQVCKQADTVLAQMLLRVILPRTTKTRLSVL